MKMCRLRVNWAHLWAFGCAKITITKQDILFEYKIPIKGPIGWTFEFSHDFNNALNRFEIITDPIKVARWTVIVQKLKGLIPK